MSKNVKQNENRNRPAPAANTHVPKNAPMMKREIMEMILRYYHFKHYIRTHTHSLHFNFDIILFSLFLR